MGGLIAQELALRHPDLVRSLVLGCTSPGGSQAIPMEAPALQMLGTRSARSPREAAENAVPFVYADDTPPHLIAEDIDVRMERPTGAPGYLGQLGAVRDYQGSASRLHTLTVPVLVVHGTADRLVPPANADLLTRSIPGARLAMLDGAGHVFVTDRTTETVRLLTQFLDEVTR
jgi:pimeloyl-ACP methyl ester carboxylesterase